MSDHPTTFRGGSAEEPPIAWDDHADLHLASDGGGVLDSAKAIRHGTFAELIRFVMLLPPEERRRYAIEKAGDRRYDVAEIEALARRPDFPAAS